MPSTSSSEGPLKEVIAATGCARALRTPSPPAPSPRIVQTPVSHVRVWLSYGGALDSAVDRQGAGRSARPGARPRGARHPRSEEHTSEIQTRMRISYAVFCLNKNKKQQQN